MTTNTLTNLERTEVPQAYPPKNSGKNANFESWCKFHTKSPAGYGEFDGWCRKLGHTHYQVKCPNCGLYSIWIKK